MIRSDKTENFTFMLFIDGNPRIRVFQLLRLRDDFDVEVSQGRVLVGGTAQIGDVEPGGEAVRG